MMVNDMFNLIKCKEWYHPKSVGIPPATVCNAKGGGGGEMMAMQQVLSGKFPKDSRRIFIDMLYLYVTRGEY